MNQFYDTLFDEVSNILMTCGGDDDFSSYNRDLYGFLKKEC